MSDLSRKSSQKQEMELVSEAASIADRLAGSSSGDIEMVPEVCELISFIYMEDHYPVESYGREP